MRSTSTILTRPIHDNTRGRQTEGLDTWGLLFHIHRPWRAKKTIKNVQRYTSSIFIRSEEQNTRHRQSSPQMMKFWRTCDEADDKTDNDDGGGSDGGVPHVGHWVKKVNARPDARQRDQITGSTHLATSPLPLTNTSKKQLMPPSPVNRFSK